VYTSLQPQIHLDRMTSEGTIEVPKSSRPLASPSCRGIGVGVVHGGGTVVGGLFIKFRALWLCLHGHHHVLAA
jgi:hypothetical protein